jgi:hypothetical protein
VLISLGMAAIALLGPRVASRVIDVKCRQQHTVESSRLMRRIAKVA